MFYVKWMQMVGELSPFEEILVCVILYQISCSLTVENMKHYKTIWYETKIALHLSKL